MNQTAKIGEAARETGLSIDAIRFYEKQGLLHHSRRTEAGYRLFGPGEIQDLKFIRKAQQLGFSLSQIRELLVLRNESLPGCVHVRELIQQNRAGVARKIEELRALERNLKAALRKCDQVLQTDGAGHTGRCPVLERIKLEAKKSKVSSDERRRPVH